MTLQASPAPLWKDGQDVTVDDLAEALRCGSPVVVVDVREPWEVEKAHLPETIHIPLVQLDERCCELPRDARIVVHCHHGGRSACAVAWLQEHGYVQVHNLLGGVDAWSRMVDPSVPRY
ncbi:MAG: hypothetical protein IPI58_03980 [Alphaproteobacteria bacterium]|nr:MAG: hypothetical protein IPI58_03980 [Alphaproteobacteria bacterium]